LAKKIISEFFDKIWYVASKINNNKIFYLTKTIKVLTKTMKVFTKIEAKYLKKYDFGNTNFEV